MIADVERAARAVPRDRGEAEERRTLRRADGRTATVLLRRDLLRFARQRSRVVGLIGQPVVLWLAFGAGLRGSFQVPGAPGVDALQYLYPGIVVMTVLFSTIFATVSVIEDRQEGFLQAILAGPGSTASVVAGKALGGTAVALLQALLLLPLLPLAGIPAVSVAWGSLLVALILTAFALTALGLALAWLFDTTAGYHAVMSLFLLPMWILSGAMFPQSGAAPALAAIMAANPMSYGVAAVRRALSGGELPAPLTVAGAGATTELGVLAATALASLFLAVAVAGRRRALEP